MNENKNEGKPGQQGSGTSPKPDQQQAQPDKSNADSKNQQAK